MQRRSIPASLALALVLALPLAAAASGASDPTMRHQAALENVTMPGTFDMIMRVLDFPVGSGAAPHTHAGPVLNIVLEDAITLRRQGTETTFATGEDWVDPPDMVHDARNTGAAKASLLATFLVPRGAQVSAPAPGGPQPPLPAPTTRSEVKIEGLVMAGQFAERMSVLDFAPGAGQPAYTHPGPAVVTVREGAFTLRRQGTARVVNAGESWVELPDVVHEVANTGAGVGTLLVTQLVPQGTTSGLPATGGGGGGDRPSVGWLAFLAGCALVAGSRLLRWGTRRGTTRRA